jgi:hypothetical protein
MCALSGALAVSARACTFGYNGHIVVILQIVGAKLCLMIEQCEARVLSSSFSICS